MDVNNIIDKILTR